MGNALTLIARIWAIALVATVAFVGQAASAEQATPCQFLPGELQGAHAAETPIFSGNDYNDRVYTLTQDKRTGAWALWVITEFKKEAGGLVVGKPCIVAAGKASKVLDAGAPARDLASDAPMETPDSQTDVAEAPRDSVAVAPAEPEVVTAAPAPDAETYRVTGIDDGAVLDLRTGPGTTFPTIVPIPPDGSGVAVGSCKKVKGYRHQWCEASWEGHEGWASACCLASERTGRRLD